MRPRGHENAPSPHRSIPRDATQWPSMERSLAEERFSQAPPSRAGHCLAIQPTGKARLKNHSTARGAATAFPARRQGKGRIFEESGPPGRRAARPHVQCVDSIDSLLACPVPAERREPKERPLSEPSESEAGNLPDPSECTRCGHGGIRRRGSVRGRRKFTRDGRSRADVLRQDGHGAALFPQRRRRATCVRPTLEGLTLRKIPDRMVVSLQTAFVWRHKPVIRMRLAHAWAAGRRKPGGLRRGRRT